jgi:hypothetical protein
MKKVGLIVVLAFIAALALSSCNREACPAYSSVDTVPRSTQADHRLSPAASLNIFYKK